MSGDLPMLVSVLPRSRFMTMDKSLNFFWYNLLICENEKVELMSLLVTRLCDSEVLHTF